MAYPCKWCGTNLDWQDGKPMVRDVNGLLVSHVCKMRPAQQSGIKSTLVDRAVIEDAVQRVVKDRVEQELIQLRIRQAQVIAMGVGDVKDKLYESWDSLSAEVKNWISVELPDVVQQAVRKLIPVEHYIKVQTPNGYDKIESRPHMHLHKVVELASLRLHSYIVGPAGGGKTTAAEQVASILGLPFYARSMGPATTEYDLMGFRSSTGEYVPGIMREPYEHGGVLCLDEMDNSNPSVLTSLNAALSGEWGSFPDKTVKRHEDFVVIAGANTYGRGADRVYVGRMQLDGASLDRFSYVEWPYDEDAEFDWAGRDQSEWVEWVQRVRHNLDDLKIRHIVSPRASINGAKMLRNGIAWEDVAEALVWKGLNEDDKVRVR